MNERIDGDAPTLRYVRDALTQAGYDPIVTAALEKALVLMEENRPRVALLDMMLPGFDGIELIRNILRIADVPVIFLSVYGNDQVIARAFGCIVKSFSPTWSIARIRRPCDGDCLRFVPSRPNPTCWAI